MNRKGTYFEKICHGKEQTFSSFSAAAVAKNTLRFSWPPSSKRIADKHIFLSLLAANNIRYKKEKFNPHSINLRDFKFVTIAWRYQHCLQILPDSIKTNDRLTKRQSICL